MRNGGLMCDEKSHAEAQAERFAKAYLTALKHIGENREGAHQAALEAARYAIQPGGPSQSIAPTSFTN